MDSWKLGLTIHGHQYDYKELLAFSSDQMVSLRTSTWEKEIYRFIITWLSDNDHIVQFSSGTTGQPKEIRLSKYTMMRSAMNTIHYLELQKGNTALLCMPVDYIAGKMMIVRSLVGELNLLLAEPKSVPVINADPSVDFCAMVPLQVLNLLICMKDLYPIRKLIIGGAVISYELEKLVQKISTEVYATYGMAETCSHIALRRLNGPSHQKAYSALEGVDLSTDSRGCLVIESSWLPGKITTNDLVKVIAPGSFVWLGRYDNLINSGGIKIVPEEVEAMIMEKTRLECVAIGLPDIKLGQKLALVFEKDQAPASFASFKNELENHLPRRWKPKALLVVDQFPRNEALKVDRRKLMEMV
jgi:O-succinylbenzoic acid--CoA ligase